MTSERDLPDQPYLPPLDDPGLMGASRTTLAGLSKATHSELHQPSGPRGPKVLQPQLQINLDTLLTPQHPATIRHQETWQRLKDYDFPPVIEFIRNSSAFRIALTLIVQPDYANMTDEGLEAAVSGLSLAEYVDLEDDHLPDILREAYVLDKAKTWLAGLQDECGGRDELELCMQSLQFRQVNHRLKQEGGYTRNWPMETRFTNHFKTHTDPETYRHVWEHSTDSAEPMAAPARVRKTLRDIQSRIGMISELDFLFLQHIAHTETTYDVPTTEDHLGWIALTNILNYQDSLPNAVSMADYPTWLDLTPPKRSIVFEPDRWADFKHDIAGDEFFIDQVLSHPYLQEQLEQYHIGPNEFLEALPLPDPSLRDNPDAYQDAVIKCISHALNHVHVNDEHKHLIAGTVEYDVKPKPSDSEALEILARRNMSGISTEAFEAAGLEAAVWGTQFAQAVIGVWEGTFPSRKDWDELVNQARKIWTPDLLDEIVKIRDKASVPGEKRKRLFTQFAQPINRARDARPEADSPPIPLDPEDDIGQPIDQLLRKIKKITGLDINIYSNTGYTRRVHMMMIAITHLLHEPYYNPEGTSQERSGNNADETFLTEVRANNGRLDLVILPEWARNAVNDHIREPEAVDDPDNQPEEVATVVYSGDQPPEPKNTLLGLRLGQIIEPTKDTFIELQTTRRRAPRPIRIIEIKIYPNKHGRARAVLFRDTDSIRHAASVCHEYGVDPTMVEIRCLQITPYQTIVHNFTIDQLTDTSSVDTDDQT